MEIVNARCRKSSEAVPNRDGMKRRETDRVELPHLSCPGPATKAAGPQGWAAYIMVAYLESRPVNLEHKAAAFRPTRICTPPQ